MKDGLLENERVVTRGAFRIDSSLQIRARPSMMQPETDLPGLPVQAAEHDPDLFVSNDSRDRE